MPPAPSSARKDVLCLGIAAQDYVFALDVMPREATKYRAHGFACVGGGIAATAAVAVARLGGSARLLTRLGDDAIGDAIIAELEGYGVDCALTPRFRGCVSSLSAVIVDEAGERMIVNYLDPKIPETAGGLPPIPGSVAVVLADTRWIAGAIAILNAARKKNIIALLDGDMPGAPRELLEAANMIAFSAEGLAGAAGVSGHEAGLRKAAEVSDALMMVTDGARGVSWIEHGTLRHVPAFEVEAVDTLGAGDVFHGALALALAEGQAMARAVLFASAAAAIKVTRFGGRAGAPRRAEVEEFLSQRA